MVRKRRNEQRSSISWTFLSLGMIVAAASLASGGCRDEGTNNTGSSGGPTCFGDTDCLEMSGCGDMIDCECIQAKCTSGQCMSSTNISAGTLAKTQVDGDCSIRVCDGFGSVMVVPELKDVADDANECTKDECVNGSAVHSASAEGSPCTLGLCNGQGKCIQCIDTTQCSNGNVCVSSKCVPPTCTDAMQGSAETDVDCGAVCPPCATGKKCSTNDDCSSGMCVGGICK